MMHRNMGPEMRSERQTLCRPRRFRSQGLLSLVQYGLGNGETTITSEIV